MFEQLPLGDLEEEHFRQKEQQVQVAWVESPLRVFEDQQGGLWWLE